MIKLLTISLFLFLKSYAQKDSVKWVTTGNEKLISNYEIQQSIDDSVNWRQFRTVSKGKSLYVYKVPTRSSYYRIKAAGKRIGKVLYPDYYCYAGYLDVGNTVTLSSPVKIASTVSFKTSNESNVAYYLIEKSSDGKIYTKTTSIPATGDATYIYHIAKTVKTYVYRITVVYKDGSIGTSAKFK